MYHTQDGLIGAQPIATAKSERQHPLGTLLRAHDPDRGAGEFIYLKGVANCAVGSWVTFARDDGSTALLAADAIGPVAVAMAAVSATEFGWFQVRGKAVGKALAGFADNGDVYATATDGSVDDEAVTGDRVQGARGASAVSDGLADFEIDNPFVDDGLGSGTGV